MVLEENNPFDKFAVCVLKDEQTVGHIPRELSKIVHFFIKHGGKVIVVITDDKYNYSAVAGGL